MLTYRQRGEELPKVTERNLFEVYSEFDIGEEDRFMIYAAAHHQVVLEMLWFHFWGVLMSSIFIYILWSRFRRCNFASFPFRASGNDAKVFHVEAM